MCVCVCVCERERERESVFFSWVGVGEASQLIEENSSD